MNFQHQTAEQYLKDEITDIEIDYRVDLDGALEMTKVTCAITGREMEPEEFTAEIWHMMQRACEKEFWTAQKNYNY